MIGNRDSKREMGRGKKEALYSIEHRKYIGEENPRRGKEESKRNEEMEEKESLKKEGRKSTHRAFKLGPLTTATFHNVLDTDFSIPNLILGFSRC